MPNEASTSVGASSTRRRTLHWHSSAPLGQLPVFSRLIGEASPLVVAVVGYKVIEERHKVPVQVNGRNSLDWSHRTCLDLKILARTIGVVTRPSGIYGETSRRDPIVDGNLTPTTPTTGTDGCREREDHHEH